MIMEKKKLHKSTGAATLQTLKFQFLYYEKINLLKQKGSTIPKNLSISKLSDKKIT